ncbi:hypothetical protein DSOL_0381 [Desulfosporosinus metallidurans]|uniref:Uncharacterized protein n=1 Tax=Desulfosporosinus metallidurans TaxID=1888891 RepID=A0A1Q8R2F0_9FIRM|nr:hypothetical protein DSOL_0381 [Desulfosporosinus metallidurans]
MLNNLSQREPGSFFLFDKPFTSHFISIMVDELGECQKVFFESKEFEF